MSTLRLLFLSLILSLSGCAHFDSAPEIKASRQVYYHLFPTLNSLGKSMTTTLVSLRAYSELSPYRYDEIVDVIDINLKSDVLFQDMFEYLKKTIPEKDFETYNTFFEKGHTQKLLSRLHHPASLDAMKNYLQTSPPSEQRRRTLSKLDDVLNLSGLTLSLSKNIKDLWKDITPLIQVRGLAGNIDRGLASRDIKKTAVKYQWISVLHYLYRDVSDSELKTLVDGLNHPLISKFNEESNRSLEVAFSKRVHVIKSLIREH